MNEQIHYRRADAAKGTYFFIVNLAERRSDVLGRYIDNLRAAMKTIKDAHPFAILAMVVLSEHLHAIWRLQEAILIIYCAGCLSRPGSLGGWQKGEHIRVSRQAELERGIWQYRIVG